MQQLFVFTGGGKAEKHYTDTILNDVRLEDLRNELSEAERTDLNTAFPNGVARVWGAVPGKGNVATWDALQRGDVLAVYKDKLISHVGSVAYKTRNAGLAERLWGKDEDGKTWELVYFVSHVVESAIPIEAFATALGYDATWFPRGFMRVSPERLKSYEGAAALMENLAGKDLELTTAFPPVGRRAGSALLWWESDPNERFWCEITDREDIGADLKSPQRDEADQEYWSYSLMRAVWPGDIVFHYSTRMRAFVGASVAGGPLEERLIRWTPHGRVGRAKSAERPERPGWWLPLYGYRPLEEPLSLTTLQRSAEREWIETWINDRRLAGVSPMAPLQLYPGQLRASQGYLTKMPRAFVERWPELGSAARALESTSTDLAALDELIPPRVSLNANEAVFRPKSASEYQAMIRASVQTRSRKHEAVVNRLAELLRSSGAIVSNQHPFDLLVTSPLEVLFEIKVVRNKRPVFAIREAIGQLLEYRFFLRRACPNLCIVLDESPGPLLAEFAESVGLQVCWFQGDSLRAGVATMARLEALACIA